MEHIFRMFEEPWRIVVPAIVFFCVATINGFYYLHAIFHSLNWLCLELKNGIVLKSFNKTYLAKDVSCTKLVDFFQMNHTSIIPTSVNYALAKVFSFTTACLWLMAFVIMLMRCIFIIDFQFMEVNISTLDDASNQVSDKRVEEVSQINPSNDGKRITFEEVPEIKYNKDNKRVTFQAVPIIIPAAEISIETENSAYL